MPILLQLLLVIAFIALVCFFIYKTMLPICLKIIDLVFVSPIFRIGISLFLILAFGATGIMQLNDFLKGTENDLSRFFPLSFLVSGIFLFLIFWKRKHNGLSAPVLKDKYFVKDGDQVIGILSDYFISDQFWIEFLLTPMSKNETLLVRLYDKDLWANSFTFVEADTERPVEFLLFVDFDDEGEALQLHDVLKSRPEKVTLRGPYSLEE